MNLNNLNEEMPYKWRVQSFSKFKSQGQCVAYVDARDVQKRLDSVCGKENWQAIYYEVGSMLFCKIGINVGDEWVWKSDTGSESNIEKEKGHSSDAFKRAGVLWGVGRFLYDMKIQYVDANEKKTKSNYPYVVDGNGKRVWDLTKHINGNSYSKPNNDVSIPKNTAPEYPEGNFMDQMKWYAIHENKTYLKHLAAWQVTSATQITDPEAQKNVFKDIEKELDYNRK